MTRTAISSESIVAGDELDVQQTVSIGVAEWNGTESAAQLEERADGAMYAAKQQGRDRVCASQIRPIK